MNISQTNEAQIKKNSALEKGQMLTSTVVAFLVLCANSYLGFCLQVNVHLLILTGFYGEQWYLAELNVLQYPIHTHIII